MNCFYLFLECRFALESCERTNELVWHLYGFSPVWIRICVRKLDLKYVEYVHAFQNQFFLLSWIDSLCGFKLRMVPWKSHMSHLAELAPTACTPFMCTFKCDFVLNRNVHWWHLNEFKTWTTILCLFNVPMVETIVSHLSHFRCFSEWIVRICFFKYAFILNILPHWLHFWLADSEM